MSQILKLFPTPLYYEENVVSEEYNDFMINNCFKIKKVAASGGKGWFTNLYNTAGTHNVVYDKNFDELNKKISHHVQEFAKSNGSNKPYKLDEGWINIYNKSDYQEFHYHTSSVFSVVYYAKIPENGGGLVLNSPKGPDMFPIEDVNYDNEFNHSWFKIYPKQRSLVIFRSFVEHMVEPGEHESERISIAYNAT